MSVVSPGCVGVSLQGVEVEKRRRQTNSNVGRSHLVLVHAGHHVLQEEQQCSQRLPVLVWKQQDGRLSRHQLLILWEICRQKADQFIFYLCSVEFI